MGGRSGLPAVATSDKAPILATSGATLRTRVWRWCEQVRWMNCFCASTALLASAPSVVVFGFFLSLRLPAGGGASLRLHHVCWYCKYGFMQVPGIALYAVWCVCFTCVCIGAHHLSQSCEATGLRTNVIDEFQVTSTCNVSVAPKMHWEWTSRDETPESRRHACMKSASSGWVGSLFQIRGLK